MEVRVYSTPDCRQCKTTYQRLEKQGIPYTVFDINEDVGKRNEMFALGYRQLPVVSVVGLEEPLTDHGNTWTGFRPDNIDKLGAVVKGAAALA